MSKISPISAAAFESQMVLAQERDEKKVKIVRRTIFREIVTISGKAKKMSAIGYLTDFGGGRRLLPATKSYLAIAKSFETCNLAIS